MLEVFRRCRWSFCIVTVMSNVESCVLLNISWTRVVMLMFKLEARGRLREKSFQFLCLFFLDSLSFFLSLQKLSDCLQNLISLPLQYCSKLFHRIVASMLLRHSTWKFKPAGASMRGKISPRKMPTETSASIETLFSTTFLYIWCCDNKTTRSDNINSSANNTCNFEEPGPWHNNLWSQCARQTKI